MRKLIKKISFMVIILAIIFNSTACVNNNQKKEKQSLEQNTLNIFVNVGDKYSGEIINKLVKEFEKENQGIKVNLTNLLGGEEDVLGKINSGEESDLIITTRNNMMELSQKGFLSDLGTYYKDNQLNDKYYEISTAYGRVGENYYGISMFPNSVEFLYNKAVLKNLNLSEPKDIEEWFTILKNLRSKKIKIPIAINEDINMNAAFMSLVTDNKIKAEDLESNFKVNIKKESILKNMQNIFKDVNELVHSGYINEDIFEVGNENSISRFINGEFPLIICSSCFSSKFTDGNTGIVEKCSDLKGIKVKNPVIIDSLICATVNSKNKEQGEKFISFYLKDKTQKKFSDLGYITSMKTSNGNMNRLQQIIIEHIYGSKADNIIYLYNMPKNITDKINLTLKDILNGKYTGSEWKDIVKHS